MKIQNHLNSRLGRRLLGWFLLLALVPLLLSNWIGYRRSHSITEGLLDSSLSTVAEVQASYIGTRIDGLILYLETVAVEAAPIASPLLSVAERPGEDAGPDAAEQRTTLYLESHLGATSNFGELFLLTNVGEVIVSTGPWVGSAREIIPAEEPYSLMTARRLSPFDPPSLILTVPMTDIRGVRLGTFGGVVRPSGLSDLFHAPPHSDSVIESFVLDEDSRPVFVFHPHGPTDHTRPLATSAVPGEGYALYTNRAGIGVVGTVSPIPGYPLRYLLEEPLEQAFGELQALRRASLYLSGFFALLVIGAAWWVSGEIVQPLRRLVHATGRLGQGDLSARVVPKGRDEISELAGAFNDMAQELAEVSERESALHQREIERAQQLATVGELASGLAHEIKNPVIGISNGLDLLRMKMDQNPRMELITGEMSRELTRIDNAIRSLLAFARPPAPHRSTTDANRIMESALTLVQPSAEKEGITVRLETEPKLPPLVADAEMLRQALVNLLVNAVQATTGGGVIKVSTAACDGGVRFTVQDTGPGIPPEKLEHIFRPFFTTRHEGTGLGLSISRKIVEQHGGQISVKSELGKGTAFRIEIPLGQRGWTEADLNTGGATR